MRGRQFAGRQAGRASGVLSGHSLPWARALVGCALAFGLLLSGCAQMGAMTGMGKSAPSAAPPEWVISPPIDTDDAMFGVGEGLDVGTATRLALRDVASKLRVSVSGSVRNQVSEANGRVDTSASSSMLSEIQKTEFRQYSLVQSAPSPAGVFALVKVDRQAFLNDTRDRIQRMGLLTGQLLGGSANGNQLDKYVALQRARPLLASQQGLFLMFKAPDLKPDDRTRQSALQRQLADADAAASKVVLQLTAAADDADVRGVLASMLSEQGLRVSEQAGASQGVLDVAAPMQVSKFGQDTIVRLSAKLTLKDNRGAVLGSREHLVTAASRSDARMARQQAVIKLQQDLKALGLLPALGIQPVSVQATQQ
jgi:hypothetical protein